MGVKEELLPGKARKESIQGRRYAPDCRLSCINPCQWALPGNNHRKSV